MHTLAALASTLCGAPCIDLAKDGETLIMLFGGGTKRGQQRDIDHAKTLFAKYKSRKGPKSARPASTRERGESMALTRSFKQTVVERVKREPAFARALLDEAATLFLNGQPETARLILHDLINAAIGFELVQT